MYLKIWSKNHRGIIIGFASAIIILVGLLALKPVIDHNNGRIHYKHRTYIRSTKQIMDANMKKNFDATKPTGKYILGKEIYDIENSPYNSTVIFLKISDGKFEVYGLSGGP